MAISHGLNIGTNALLAQQRALDVTGQNIANAANEGYSRQRAEFSTLPPSRWGHLFFGNGSSITDVRRIFDQQVENRLQRSLSTSGSLNRQKDVYEQLERAVNALGDDPDSGIFVSMGGQIDQFFNQLRALSSTPADPAMRSLFISQAQALTFTMNKLGEDVQNLRASYNESAEAAVRSINELSVEIADLNDSIVHAELGGAISGQANDLRDRRDLLLRQLSEFTNVSVNEQANGAVDVRVGGDFLVNGNDAFLLETNVLSDRGVNITTVEFAISGNEFRPREGELGGLLLGRDDILPGFLRDLDAIARTMMTGFNQVHSTGRGITGLKTVTSNAFTAAHALNSELPLSVQGTVQRGNEAGTFLVDPNLMSFPNGLSDPEHFLGAKVLFTSGANEGRTATITRYDPATGRLDLTPPLSGGIAAGDAFEITSLDYPIQNGSFKLNVRNDVTGVTDVFDIQIDRDGLPSPPNLDDTTLQELVQDINIQLGNFYGGSSPVRARINDEYQLVIESTGSETSFHFSDDTSGFLAAAGMNTLFGGSDALSMHVKDEIANNHSLLATALSSSSGDNANVERLAALQFDRLMLGGTTSVDEFYRGMIGAMAVEGATANELAKNQEFITQAATNARERISGVNVDEEAIDLIKFQRAFQAAARYLGVVDSMLAELMNIL